MVNPKINQLPPSVQKRFIQKFCSQIGLANDDRGKEIAKKLIDEFNGNVNMAILSYGIREGTLPAPALYRVGPNGEKNFLRLMIETVPVQLGAAPTNGITVKHEKGSDGRPIGMADVAATIKYIRVGNIGDFLLEVSGSNAESSDGTASFFLFDSWMKGWDDPGERIPVPSTRLLNQYNDTKYFLSEDSQFVSRSRGNDSLDIIGVYIPPSAAQVINEPEEMDLDTAESAGGVGRGSNNNMMEESREEAGVGNISHEFSQLSTEKTVHGNEEGDIRRILRDVKDRHNTKHGSNYSTQEYVQKGIPELRAQHNQQDSIPDDYRVPMPFLQESAKDDPLKLLFQHTSKFSFHNNYFILARHILMFSHINFHFHFGAGKMSDVLELALDTDIYKVLESGTLSQCLAKLLSLENFKRYGMHLRRFWRGGEAPHDAMRLFLDAEENGLELGYEGDPDDAPDDKRSFFQHSGNDPTPATIQKWLATLAPCYIKEFSHHFGDSEDAVQAELDKFAASSEHFSLLMIAVASRFLRAHVVLFLPGASEPLLLLPYPMQNGEHSAQWGDHSNHIVRLQLSADGTLNLVVHKDFDDNWGCTDDADDEEVPGYPVLTKNMINCVLKPGGSEGETKRNHTISLNSLRKRDGERVVSRCCHELAQANKVQADEIIDVKFPPDGGPYHGEDIEMALRSNGVSTYLIECSFCFGIIRFSHILLFDLL